MTRCPLQGVRIADFTWAWAGPYGTMLLAFMGAEVIKIESTKRPDHSRILSLAAGPTLGGPNLSSIFNDLNLNKMSITLDMTRPEAVELAKRVVSISDVVAENFRPGVMDKLGLGYKVLKKVKPDIIMLSSSAVGGIGPQRHYIGYAPTFASLGGMAHLTGFPDGPPIPQMGSTDLRSATASAFAILVALYHRALTGKGQHIDLSSTETIAVLTGEALLEYTMNGRIPTRDGNRDKIMAPHNLYPCREKNSRVSIAVATEEEWQALCKVMGDPSWAKDEKFSDPYRRWHNQEELDRLIGDWTVNYSATEVMQKLQQAGVAAMPSFGGNDLFQDPHLKERGFAKEVEHPAIGKRLVINVPWKFSATPAEVSRYGPLLGEHNDYVFGELLGMPANEIAKLQEQGVIH